MQEAERDLTEEYENGAYIPDAEKYKENWPIAAAAFRAEHAGQLDLRYGPKDRNKLDLFLPRGRARGLMVFIHGGYWRALDKSLWSHLAAGPLARGWAVALPSYTLAPQARIAEITAEAAQAVSMASDMVPDGPLVVTGHSAGGHLTARLRCVDVALSPRAEARLARLVPISPLSDLRPLLRTAMNADLRLDAGEAEAESPLLFKGLREVETRVWVGAEERPAFLDQARWLAEAWGAAHRIDLGRHHFDVIDGLTEAASPLTEAVLGGLE